MLLLWLRDRSVYRIGNLKEFPKEIGKVDFGFYSDLLFFVSVTAFDVVVVVVVVVDVVVVVVAAAVTDVFVIVVVVVVAAAAAVAVLLIFSTLFAIFHSYSFFAVFYHKNFI